MGAPRISGILGRKDGSGEARAYLGVFGKHPGWNDHIDDIGLATERLVQIKRILYVEGIGGNIDAGAWDSIPEPGLLPGFDHLFLWRSGGEVAIGRFWSSKDGKGRSRYPMVACAQISAQPVTWQVRYIAPLLERLRDDFRAADTADRVIALSENALREIDALAAGEPTPADRQPSSATAQLAADPAMGPERRGMYRLLYQMERELASYLRGGMGDGSRSRIADLTPRHLRVPRCLRDEGESLVLWWRFFGEHLGDGAPLVLLSPRGQPWIDVLVGEPGVSQFTCVRAAESTIPLSTEIPYSYDQTFIARANERISGTAADPGADAAPRKIQQAGAGLGGAIDKIKSAGAGRSIEPRQIAMIAGAVLLGIFIIVGVIALLSGPSGGKGPDPADEPAPRPAPSATPGDSGAATAPTSAAFGPQQRADFAEWCAQADWALQLRDRIASADLSVLRADPHLASTVVPLLDALRSPDLILDPRRIATGGARQLSALGASPPPSAQTDEGIARTAAALGVIRGLRGAVGSGVWPARATIDRVAEAARRNGWTSTAEALAGVSSRVTLDGAAPLATLEAVATIAPHAARIEAAAQRFDRALRDVAERQGTTTDPRLSRLPDLLARAEAPVGSGVPAEALSATAGRIESAAALAEEIAATVRERWPVLDLPYFLASTAVGQPAGSHDEAYFRAWIQEARRDAYALLDPDDDPRRSWDAESRLAAIGSAVGSLRGSGGVDAGDVDRLERDLRDLRERFAAAVGLGWDRDQQARVLAAAGELDRGISALEGSYDRLTGRLAEQWDRETSRLRERAVVAGVTSPALLGAWRERRDALLERFTTHDRLAVLTDRVEALEEYLVSAERAVPQPRIPRERPSVLDADALERAMVDERERRIERILASARWTGEAYDAAGADAWRAAGVEMADWSARIDEAARAMAHVEEMLGAAYGTREAGPGGRTIVSLLPGASESAVGATIAAVFAPLTERARRVAEVEAERDAAALARIAADPAAPLAESLAAWRALGHAEWPVGPAQVRAEGEISRVLAARTSAIGDAGRVRAIGDELRSAQAGRWLRAAERIRSGDDAQALREVLAMRDAFGVGEEALSPALRLNVLIDRFARAAAEAGASSDSDALKRRAAELVAACDALDLPAAALGPAGPWLNEVRALLADAPAAPVVDPTTLGPGAVGWRGEEFEAGQRVRFTSPDGALTLEFARVEPGDSPGLSEAAYLCTTELSIGVLQWAAAQGGNLQRLRALTEESPPTEGMGIKTWAFDARPGRDGVVPAEGWVLSRDVATGIQPWATGLNPGRPGLKTPVTQIPPAAAAAVAEWLGCRLPALSEWQAAKARYESGGGGEPPAWNLRDNTWAAQLRYVRSVHAGGRMGIRFPDEGVFRPEGSTARTEAQATSFPSDDRALFLEDVDAARGRTMRHLMGNAAEFVVFSGGSSPQFGVIGASALTAPEDYQALQSGAALPPEMAVFGWADVGVRLAFSAKAEGGAAPLWRRVQRLGASAPLVLGP